MAEKEETPFFAIEKLYVKDLSVEVPNAPAVFTENGNPEINLQLQTAGTKISDDLYEAVLTTTVTAKTGEKTLFLVEVRQAGVFRIRNIPEENLEPLLSIACPNVLFPYAREAVSDSINRAGFPPVLLQPVNFEAMYAARLQQQQQAQAETAKA